MEVFSLTGGFSGVNTRLSFDTELLVTNLTESDYSKQNIDESFKAYKRDDLKLIYKIKLDNEDSFHNRRIITKILKMDESNQYGFAMTKPMPTGCIKELPAPTWRKFNFFLETVDLDNPIGHLFIANIEFDKANVMEREYMYNETMSPIMVKQKSLEANERSVYQLLDLFSKTDDNKPKSFRCTAKSHATLFPKKFIPLYLVDLKFLITRCCSKITQIHSYYSFEQWRFKRDFVLMNQKLRQNAKDAIENDFFKLMNNSNFGYDCRNNLNNAKFELIIDEIDEISYIKR